MVEPSADRKVYVEPSAANVTRELPADGTVAEPLHSPISTRLARGEGQESRQSLERLRRFQTARTVREALEAWWGAMPPLDRSTLARRLNQDIARIDRLLNDQLNAILHHPSFQRLEASWRGVEYLVNCQAEEADSSVKIRLLTVTRKEIERDFERSLEFDQSDLFKKVYEDEFGTPGGEPIGALIADFEMQPTVSPDHPHNDVALMRSLSQVGAAAFCPVIANASPAMLGLDDFKPIEHTIDWTQVFGQANYLSWNSLRQSEDSRFLGLAMPRILMRRPYQDDGTRVDDFCFHEDVTGPDDSKYLWGGAAFAMGEVLIRAFSQAGWLADIRGVKRNQLGGGLVTRLPIHDFDTDAPGVATRFSTDVVITDELEKQLSELGLIPLCHCKDTDFCAFYSNQSIQKPKRYDRSAATTNAQISSMLQYIFCVSRFAHYVKVLGRDRTGSYATAAELQTLLYNWIVRYVTADVDASVETKAQYPLRSANVQVIPVPGKPGSFSCTMHLAPHYELDELNATVTLQAELTPMRTG